MARRDEKNRYFMAVKDYEIKVGTVDNMVLADSFRSFNEKFVDSPELALLIAFDRDNERWTVPDPAYILKDIVYDEENKEWKRTSFQTTNGHTPNFKQIEKWKRGEYELCLVTEYVQVMETHLIGGADLVDRAADKWIDKLNKVIYSRKNKCECECKCSDCKHEEKP